MLIARPSDLARLATLGARLRWLAAIGALALSPLAARAASEPGVLWEQTVELSSKEFAMPATTQQVCQPRGTWSQPPAAGGDPCTVDDVHVQGNRMSWKMTCGGAEPMTGEGELERSAEAFSGKIAMHGKKQDMLMKLHGRLLGGACDPDATTRMAAGLEKKAKEAQRASDENVAKMCADAAEQGNVQLFAGSAPACKGDERKQLCTHIATRPGYARLHRFGANGLQQAGEVCRLDIGALGTSLCSAALAEAKPGAAPKDALSFIGSSCPAERQTLARRECAGRGYTGVKGDYHGFCVTYARAELEEGHGESQGASSKDASNLPAKAGDAAKDAALEKGKGMLKGLFGK